MEDYKQKYEIAIKQAKKELRTCGNLDCDAVRQIFRFFPELKESEDEKIRKEIIESVQGNMCVIHKDKCIAWLEKQGEHKSINKIQLGKKYKCIASPRYTTFMIGEIYKPEDKFLCSLMNFCSDCFELIEDGEQKTTDKVEPKFKAGDCIVRDSDGFIITIESIRDGIYYFRQGGESPVKDVDEIYRLWTIKDANDGDVLVTDNGDIYIFDGTVEEGIYPFAYCGLTRYGFESYDRRLPFIYDKHVYPSTQEQRGLLFQKMKEAGYEWDSEKKELRKIEQKPTWSEEDSQYAEDTLSLLGFGASVHSLGEVQDWLNSIKEGKPHPKQEWSEEDEYNLNWIINDYERALQTAISSVWEERFKMLVDWLKSIKERYTWKPSDEQINALKFVMEGIEKDFLIYPILNSILEQLKKLK